MSAKADLLRTSRILTSTPLMRNLSCRKRSTWRRPIISTMRLLRMFSRRLSRRLSRRRPCEWPCPCATADSSVACPWHRDRSSAASLCRRDTHTCWSKGSHERAIQIDVDLTEQRMQPVIHWSHGVGQVEIVPVGSCHLRLHMQHRVGEIQVIVARSGYEELYRSTRVQ